MSALSPAEQELYDVAKGALPRWLFQDGTAQELVGAFAKVMQMSRVQAQAWLDATYILKATGFWLDQHARDRGTARQNNEGDVDLRTRLRSYSDTVTTLAIEAAVNRTLTLAGVAGTCQVWESRRDQAYYHTPTNKTFFARGWRYGLTNHSAIIVVVPSATSAGTLASITALVRQITAGGVDAYIEKYDPAQLFVPISLRPAAIAVHVGSGAVAYSAATKAGINNALFNWPVLNPAYGTFGVGTYTPPAVMPPDGTVDVLGVGVSLISSPTNQALARIKLLP